MPKNRKGRYIVLDILEKKLTENPTTRKGLTTAEAEKRLSTDGENRLAKKKKTSAAKIFAGQFHDVMVMILLVSVVISVALGQYADAVPIVLIVIINAALGFIQEYRCEKTLEKLENMTAPTAMVYRDGRLVKIPASEVVAGDVFTLEAGDRVPCDGYINSSRALSCDESALTGEAVPAVKKCRTSEIDFTALNKDYMVYMGTVVTKGVGEVTAVATGERSQMGRVSTMLDEIKEPETPLQKKLGELGRTLAIICLAVCVVVFIAGVLRGEPVLNMAMTGITIAIAAIPEGLPATVTIALALAVRKMLKRQALVHRLHSVETLGCATVICTDKTGTVTMNKMTVTDIFTCTEKSRAYSVTKEGASFDEKALKAWESPDLGRILLCGAACNNARLCPPEKIKKRDRGGRQGELCAEGDPTETAILIACANAGINVSSLGYRRTDELPFESETRSMTVICADEKGVTTAFRKGAFDVIIKECSHVFSDSCELIPFGGAMRKQAFYKCDEYASKGLRVIAFSQQVDGEWAFLGLMAMKDPLRAEAAKAVAECQRAGIKTVMITGDHKLTAQAIAKEAGIMKAGSIALTGDELDRMDDKQLDEVIENCCVFARVTPEHKLRIVKAFKNRGHVCAMTGDGVNDAPAIKEADIGVSMGISGTEVTKQAADVILLDDNFATLVNSVEEGRTIYQNIRKFVRYLISCNIGEVITMLGGIIMGLPMVLLPAQILLVNLVTDSLPAIALGLEPAESSVMKKPPRKEDDSFFSGGLMWHIVIRGLLIGICTLASFTVLLTNTHSLGTARTGALITLVLSQLIHVFECKSEEKTLFTVPYLSNPFLLFSVFISAAALFAGIWLPVLQKVFFTAVPSLGEFLVAASAAAIVPVGAGIIPKLFMGKKSPDVTVNAPQG